MSEQEVQLHPLVRALLSELELSSGRLRLAAATLESWKGRLAGVADDEREGMAAHLVAAAIKIHRMGGEAASEGVAQLCELTAHLIGTRAAAAVFAASDLPKERYAKVLGAESTVRAPKAQEQTRPPITKKPRKGLS